ncbi:peptidase domain-containing ABC transporter [Flammeovirga aprica]|uniref:ABC transporter ATP-binding protein n=1 Tax=Flammeovirga aprica JL-4 TaxID=694437 RepID=A0A7X9S059_9BACT|nr:ABC transporter ATP-binding protein [Flammeovirga aprica]NME71941.1 ABC transporter ATP-binding protein [Flammeovirga aprica JL-4]
MSFKNLVEFIHSYQDVSISINRLSDIYNEKSDNTTNERYLNISNDECITLKNVSFSHFGSDNKLFDNLNLSFPTNKISAIVGSSGSGKTTILKLLLKYYQPNSGGVYYKGTDINNIDSEDWRQNISTVFQDGYIFSDSIKDNIIMGDELDENRYLEVLKLANCYDFITKLPQKSETKIGENGIGLSKGQLQRILIARAMYKNSSIIILDEATSALDAKNEKEVHNNLLTYFKDKTVIIIAHRLSTVKNADRIFVLDNGSVIEEGNHRQLVNDKNNYYELVKNQLELA